MIVPQVEQEQYSKSKMLNWYQMINFDKKTKLFSFLIILAISSIIIIPNIPQSYGHAFITKSDPASSQSLTIPPTKVDVYFSNPIDIRFSQVQVLDSNGKQIQLSDQHYTNPDQTGLSVSLPAGLKDGIYTVTTRVLDQTDGHVTDKLYFFGIGKEVPKELEKNPSAYISDIVFIPGAIARFPSLLGQIMVTGIIAATLWLWSPINRISKFRDAISQTRIKIEVSMIRLSVIGSIVILASGFAMIVVQSIAINVGILDAVSTKFGNMWVLRMIASSILFALAIVMYYKTKKSPELLPKSYLLLLLGVSVLVLLTTSLISHGAATGKIVPLLLDFFHNVFASLWIGGIIYLAFVVMPHLRKITSPNLSLSTISLVIPRFSTLVITVLGAVTITGPFLLYMLEGNIALTLASFYGKILIIKLVLAATMIAFGAYDHMFINNSAYSLISNKASKNTSILIPQGDSILKKFHRSIKIEAILGIILIASVATLVDSGLPSNEFQGKLQSLENKVFALTINVSTDNNELSQTRFVENGSRVVLSITPFATGGNDFTISFLDSNKHPIEMKSAQIKLTQTDIGTESLTSDTNKTGIGTFTARSDFGFPGHWTLRVEGVQNKENSLNLVSSFYLFVKPKLDNLQLDIKEYKTPGNSSTPRYPVYDSSRNKVWVADTIPKSGKILDFDLGTYKYTEHKIDGLISAIYTALDSHNILWYIDYQRKILGNYNPDNGTNLTYPIPNQGILTSMVIDNNDTIWITSANTNEILKFEIKTAKFGSIKLPDKSDPLGIAIDNTLGKLWIAEGIGKISSLDISNNRITEFAPPENYTMKDPTAIILDSQTGKVYISEHSGNAVSVFDPLLKTFKKIPLDPNPDNLPFGMAFDKYHNLWVAQHTFDKISTIDPRTGKTMEIQIPSKDTLVQWLTSDSQGNIIIAEENASALGIITITAGQSQGNQPNIPASIPKFDYDYSQVVAPSITGLLVVVAFFYCKGVVDLKEASDQVRKIQEF